MLRLSPDDAVRRAATLAASGKRRILGITGPPGAGKSTLARLLHDKIDGSVVVGMDAYHLAHSALERLGLAERKGAPETFDAAGYVALLRRIRAGEHVWAPEFRREIEDAIAGAVAVPPEVRLVITEGNYLLLGGEQWRPVRALADEIWYADLPEDVRHARLAARHEAFGRTKEQAWERTLGSDERNARLVIATREAADAVVAVPTTGEP
ncbi:nucleoside/nucleotide kinase family protein [Nonomuraea typhae]|uniref:nucleoside/nucleotide kinase family protein n=1 Tax=Nonomuraea typhae TaxID=2603600 RepID=UPI001FE56E4D|nr:nucleoside/nucleotide kinase family protein [Nonomuraea typhae]